MRIGIAVVLAMFAVVASAKLPPPPESAKAQAAEAAAKTAWSDKVAQYKLCLSIEHTAQTYRQNMKAAGKPAPEPQATPPCTDPGPFVTPIAQKPLEASGAHSPAGPAHTPPSSNATAAELTGSKK
jgi:hypothetical protein